MTLQTLLRELLEEEEALAEVGVKEKFLSALQRQVLKLCRAIQTIR